MVTVVAQQKLISNATFSIIPNQTNISIVFRNRLEIGALGAVELVSKQVANLTSLGMINSQTKSIQAEIRASVYIAGVI